MIVSRGRRFIFVHIPKTGGTSLALALEARALKDDILIGDTPKARRRRARLRGVTAAGRLWKHSRLADLPGLLTEDEIARFFTFTIVRNPFERVASYYHWLRVQKFDHPAVAAARALPFDGFIADAGVQAALRAAPYGSYLRDTSGHERCDMVLRLERFDADVAALGDRLGLRLHPVPHANRSDRPDDHRALYSEAARRIVEDVCAEDLERFGYAF